MAIVSRKTEVTKLITVTLGKIQESKHAKCGLNLRKSLLVASVLHKARDIYVTEVKNRVVERAADSSTDSSSCNGNTEAKVRRFSSQRSMSVIEEESIEDETSSNESIVNSQCTDQSSDNNTTSVIRPRFGSEETISQQTETHSAVDDILDELASNSEQESATTDKENSPPASKSFAPAISCGRCLKRRVSTDYPDSTTDTDNNNYSSSDYPTPYYSSKKRSRSNAVDSPSECDNEDRNAMDTTQINSLVNIFSQSFSEFTSTESSDVSSSYEPSTELNTFALYRDSVALTA